MNKNKGTAFAKELHALLHSKGMMKGFIASAMGHKRGVFWGKVNELNGYKAFSEKEKQAIRNRIIKGK